MAKEPVFDKTMNHGHHGEALFLLLTSLQNLMLALARVEFQTITGTHNDVRNVLWEEALEIARFRMKVCGEEPGPEHDYGITMENIYERELFLDD